MGRLKRNWKRIGLTLGALLIVLLLANAILVWITGNRLEDRLTRLRAAGEPITLTDLIPATVPIEQNAATFLDRARSDLRSIVNEINAVRAGAGYGHGPLSESDRKKLRSAFDAYPNIMPLLRQASTCSDYHPSLDYSGGPEALSESFLAETKRCNWAMIVLDARTRLLIAEGRVEAALEDAITALRLCRRFEREPQLIGQLILFACRRIAIDSAFLALNGGPVSEMARDELDAILAQSDNNDSFLFGWQSERADRLDEVRALLGTTWFFQAICYDNQSYVIDTMQPMIELIGKPYTDVKSLETKIASTKHSIWPRFPLLSVPTWLRVLESHDRSIAFVRCLRVFNALQRHGGEPALTALGLPPSALVDPYTGDSLHVKKTANGWVVYSVGSNLIDDGGSIGDDFKDIGIGPSGQ